MILIVNSKWYDKLYAYSKCETTLMLHRLQRMPSLRITRFVPVSICFCAFFSVSQVDALACVVSAEMESPCKGDGERSENELVDRCSAHGRPKHSRRSKHGRSNNRRHQGLNRPLEKCKQCQRVPTIAERVPAIIGHQLANGLCAPLLI